MKEIKMSEKEVRKVEEFFGNVAPRVKGRRASIKQLLDRKSVYTLQDYARKTSKKIGTEVTKGEVRNALLKMAREGQIMYELKGERVYGFTL